MFPLILEDFLDTGYDRPPKGHGILMEKYTIHEKSLGQYAISLPLQSSMVSASTQWIGAYQGSPYS